RRLRRAQPGRGAGVHVDAGRAAIHPRRSAHGAWRLSAPLRRARSDGLLQGPRRGARAAIGVPGGPRALSVAAPRVPHRKPDVGRRRSRASDSQVAAWAGGRGLGDDRLRVAGISLHYGGDPDVARILHAAQPYTGWAGFVESANSPEAYREQAELAARHRLRINTLVTRNLAQILDVWEKIAQSTPIADLRWVAVHLNAATGDQIARLKRLGAVATTNPISYLWRSAADEARKLGDASETLLPHRSLERVRVPFGLATDNK